jgi:large conductance mechanosensitive channel
VHEGRISSAETRVDVETDKPRGAAMFKEFRDFAMKGNVVDLAIGVVIGAAFSKIVSSLVEDIVMPIIGVFGKADFSNYFIPLSAAVTAGNLADARKQGGVLAYGSFVTNIINFAIVAVALFFVVKFINRFRKKEEKVALAPTTSEVLLMEIRDTLKTERAV